MSGLMHISKVAIVGAAGNSGRFMTEELLKTGKTVTAITRVNSPNTFPPDVLVRKVYYDQRDSLVGALKGQDALIITLSGHAKIDEIETQLVNAANSAGVPWILRNEWGPDTENEALVRDVSVFKTKTENRQKFEDLDKSSFIAICTGFWYEWSLAMPAAFGFDFANKKVTLFDDGDAKISVSTWPHIGRAVAALLSLPYSSSVSQGPCLQDFRNKVIYTNAFVVSQNDILESVIRVTGTQRDDWEVTKEISSVRYAKGVEQIKQGNWKGMAAMMYTRVFYPDGCGNFEGKGTINEALHLPREHLDAATQRAINRAEGL